MLDDFFHKALANAVPLLGVAGLVIVQVLANLNERQRHRNQDDESKLDMGKTPLVSVFESFENELTKMLRRQIRDLRRDIAEREIRHREELAALQRRLEDCYNRLDDSWPKRPDDLSKE